MLYIFLENPSPEDNEMITLRLLGLIATVEVRSHIKRQLNEQPTDEDKLKVKECIVAMNKMVPHDKTALLFKADSLTNDGKISEALAICDEIILNAESNDGVPYVLKANVSQVLLSEAIVRLQSGDHSAAPTFHLYREQVIELYNKALSVDFNCIEAMVQLAHMEGMLGEMTDLQKSLELLERACNLAHRSFEDMVDVVSQRNHMRCLLNALTFVQENQASAGLKSKV